MQRRVLGPVAITAAAGLVRGAELGLLGCVKVPQEPGVKAGVARPASESVAAR